jgi:hypothetical protein
MPKPQYCRQSAYDLFRLQMPIIDSTDGLLYAAVAIAMNHLEVCTPRLAEDLVEQYSSAIRSRVRSGSPQALLAQIHPPRPWAWRRQRARWPERHLDREIPTAWIPAPWTLTI